ALDHLSFLPKAVAPVQSTRGLASSHLHFRKPLPCRAACASREQILSDSNQRFASYASPRPSASSRYSPRNEQSIFPPTQRASSWWRRTRVCQTSRSPRAVQLERVLEVECIA